MKIRNVDLQLFIDDKQWANKNVIHEFYSHHHPSWLKAGKLYYNVKKEMENEKETDWLHLYQNGSIFKL